LGTEANVGEWKMNREGKGMSTIRKKGGEGEEKE